MRKIWIVLALASGACGAGGRDSGSTASERASPNVQLALLEPSHAGDSAAKVGRLEVLGPCLYVIGADGARTIPAFMTFDTRWLDGELIVGSKRFRPGQMVKLGGSEISEKIADLAWVQRPAPSCYAPTYWITASIDPL